MPTGSEAFLELPIALGYGPATGPTLNTALCHIRTLVGRRINTALCVQGRPEKGNADRVRGIFGTAYRVGATGPATGPTLNTALCHIRTLGGT